ncbi:hypothetical protein [Salinimicrobium sp. WS361]|uniref:hypothetical protein n=1 Tax=Salinimicrobium sp. WS361 TaxID=3425123 RepID=UPI003D6E719C
MENYPIPKKVTARLMKVIQSIVTVHSIYLIGVQRESCSSLYVLDSDKECSEGDLYTITLLIISEEYIALTKEFMNEVFTKMDQRVKLYSIHYTLNDVRYRLNSGDNFLSRVLLPENTFFCSHRLLVFGYCHHPKMYDIIHQEWEFRMKRAYYFEDKADVSDSAYDQNAKMLLLSQALQQACAALLYVFWEWKTPYYDLNYLLNLCSHFCQSPKMLFPKSSFRSYKEYHALCHAQYNVNFKSNSNVSLEETYHAHALCRRFLDKANLEGTKKLQELYQLHNFSGNSKTT